MKQKYVAPLAIIFLALLGLVLLKQMRREQPTLVQQVELKPLVPSGLAKADIAKLELYSGGAPEEKTVLSRDPKDPNVWWATSQFNAPADKDKIEKFIEKVLELKGESRDTVEEDAGLDRYGLKDDAAFYVKGYKPDAEDASFAVLVGKAPAFNQVFMRAAGAKDIFVADVNLRREAGVYSDDATTAPKADTWLKKEVVNIAKATINKITVETPEKRLVLAKEKKEVPIEESAEEGDGEDAAAAEPSEQKDAAGTETKPETKTEEKWVLAEGGPGGEPKPASLENLSAAFQPLTATDIVDPTKLADWGLETPAFTCRLAVEGKEGDVVIEGGRPDPNGDGYVRVASANKDVIFKLSKFTFEKIFPKGSDFFDLAGLTFDRANLARVEIMQPAGNASIVKESDSWRIASPGADLPALTSTLDAIANALSSWKPVDYADKTDTTGIDAPTRSVTVTLASGESHTIAAGNDSKGVAGVYARLDGTGPILVMSKGDLDRIFVAPKDLFERSLLDLDETEISTISVERAEDTFSITRADDEKWTLTPATGEAMDADHEKCDDLAAAVAGFEASDIVFGRSNLPGEPVATVRCVMKDGTQHALWFGPEESGTHAVSVDAKAQLFRSEKLDVEEILVPSASLKRPEPKSEETPGLPTGSTPGAGEAQPAATETPAAQTAPEPPAAEPASKSTPEAAEKPAEQAAPTPEASAPGTEGSATPSEAPAESAEAST
jgi:hypothetical protein